MIEKCEGWKIDGVMYAVLEEAQAAAIAKILDALDDGVKHEEAKHAAAIIINHRAEVLAILSLEPPKERKTRADKGTRRTKKIAPVAKETPHVNPPEVGAAVEGSGKYKGR